MAILSDEDKGQVREMLEDMDEEIDVYVFTTDDCDYCEDTIELNEEILDLTDKINFEEHDLDSDLAAEYDAAKYENGPVTVLTREGVSGVTYFGIPSGHEFSSYLQDLIVVSTGETDLEPNIEEALEDVDEEVNIKVFVTPTCPHCPGAVRTAHDFAVANDNITGEMIESQEFMELSQEYGVRGVPQININGTDAQFTGARPPQQFLDEVKNALK